MHVKCTLGVYDAYGAWLGGGAWDAGGGDGGNACSGGGCSLAGNHDAGSDGVLDGNFGDRTAGGAD